MNISACIKVAQINCCRACCSAFFVVAFVVLFVVHFIVVDFVVAVAFVFVIKGLPGQFLVQLWSASSQGSRLLLLALLPRCSVGVGCVCCVCVYVFVCMCVVYVCVCLHSGLASLQFVVFASKLN